MKPTAAEIGADGEVRTVAVVAYPAGVAVDAEGRLWVVDRDEGVILRSCAP